MNAIINGMRANLQYSGPSLRDCPKVPKGEEDDYVFVTNMSKDDYESDCLDPTLCFIGEPHHEDPKIRAYLERADHYAIYYHKDHLGFDLKADVMQMMELCRELIGEM